jgi:hypothetical protein
MLKQNNKNSQKENELEIKKLKQTTKNLSLS